MGQKGFSTYRNGSEKTGIMIADGEGQWVQRSAAEMIVDDMRKYKAEAHTLTEERDYAIKLGEELSHDIDVLRNDLKEAEAAIEETEEALESAAARHRLAEASQHRLAEAALQHERIGHRREINLKRELHANAKKWRNARHAGLVGKIRKACGR